VNSEALRQAFEANKVVGLSRTLPTITSTSLLSSIFTTPLPSPHHTFTFLPSFITPSHHHHQHHQQQQKVSITPNSWQRHGRHWHSEVKPQEPPSAKT
jgi:hypothetical protein